MSARVRSDPRARQGHGAFSLETDLGRSRTDIQGDYRAYYESRPHSTGCARLGLVYINIDDYAEFYQNIPHGPRLMGNFCKLIWDNFRKLETDTQRTPKVDHLLRVVQFHSTKYERILPLGD